MSAIRVDADGPVNQMESIAAENGIVRGGIWVLIVAEPCSLRNSLQALLATMPRLRVIQVDSIQAAWVAIECYHPALLFVDLDLPGDEVQHLLRQLSARAYAVRSILLANDVQQQKWAEAAGADMVLLKGFPASRLTATVGRLLP